MIEQKDQTRMLDLSVNVSEAAPQFGKQVISLLNRQGFEVYAARRRSFGLNGITFKAIVRHETDHAAALAAVKLAFPNARICAQLFSI